MIKIITFILLIGLISCDEGVRVVNLMGPTMGTIYNIKFVGKISSEQEEKMKVEVTALLNNVNQQMSTYVKDSEISYFNQFDRLGEIKISDDFFYVTKYSLTLAHKSLGFYDPTIGPLVNLWGFGPDGERKIPSNQAIKEARALVGYKKIRLNEKKQTILKTTPGVYLDLSSSAKGFGVDKISTYLDSKNIDNYMVEIGGEVRLRGHNKKQLPWSIAIESVDEKNFDKPYELLLSIKNVAIATSGNYRNFFINKGKHYSHTINYKTGKPVEHTLASVTVVTAKECMKADALATALMAMGPEKGMAFAEKEKIAAYFIYKVKKNYISKGTSAFTKMTEASL